MSLTYSRPVTIALIAGETSGDILGVGLVKALKKKYPNASFVGIAGPKMKSEGVVSLFDMNELSVMGLVEVLKRLPRLLKIRRDVYRHILAVKPDIFIGIDAPDFNLPLEKKLKAKGIKTVHYVSPSIWAWRQSRVHTVAKATHQVLCLFPFEKQFYDSFNVPCTFVGHTLADETPLMPDVKKARERLKVEGQGKVIAVLPGSRYSEVNMLLPTFIQAIDKLLLKYPQLEVLLPVVDRERKLQVEQLIDESRCRANIRIVIGHSREAMIASDAVLLASGTATLEAMLAKKPMVVAYKFTAMTFWILKRLVKTPYVSIPNILADEGVIPELIQDDATPSALMESIDSLLKTPQSALTFRFTELHKTLKRDADHQAAAAVESLLECQS